MYATNPPTPTVDPPETHHPGPKARSKNKLMSSSTGQPRVVTAPRHEKLMRDPRLGRGRCMTKTSAQCYLTATTLSKKPRTQPATVVPQDPEDSARDPHPTEKVLELPLDPSRPDRLVKVGLELTESQQVQLVEFL
ncbi:hypothetical protein BHE74_00033172 [Ensete ventricosum]|nr:hypothetical protein BHE74_00033172 [Ensete ventricosum]